MNKVICLMGPTASGKTDLAIKLVEQFPLEIISVDSAMIYRGMDIGTAKPTADILKKAPHHLIDILDPKESYSAAQFVENALREIKIIFQKNKTPLLVGGTMLYFRALLFGLSELPSADPIIRKQLADELEKIGLDKMHQRLMQIDPLAAKRIHPNDPQRILRALEVYEQTGINLTTLQEKEALPFPYEVCSLAIAPKDRAILHERIAFRFKKMIADGFIDEVRGLFERGDLHKDLPSMRSVGYRQVWEYLEGRLTEEEMLERGIIATRQLAKRQLTWLRSWPRLSFFENEKTFFADIKMKVEVFFKS